MIKAPRPPYDLIVKTPIEDCREKFVDLLTISEKIISGMTEKRMKLEMIKKPVLIARESVAKKLLEALDSLDDNEGILLFDAFRPTFVQQKWFEEEMEIFRKAHPDMKDEKCIIEVSRWLSPARTSKDRPPSPHSTGGAIDISLIKIKNGNFLPVDMGSDYGEWSPQSWTNSKLLTHEQTVNRKRLKQIMLKVGMVNYEGEWWHFVFGDQFWAVKTKHKAAIYDEIEINI